MVIPGDVFDAHQSARQILEAARADAERIREEARREGLEAGRQEGLATVTEKLLRAAVVTEQRVETEQAVLVRLAVKIAERILARQLTLAPEMVADVARAALAAARARDRIALRVHPDDAAAVAALGVPTVPDPQVARGGCVVETDLGRFDARLEVQLRAVERALVKA